jgi:nucleoid DNA-binding protein
MIEPDRNPPTPLRVAFFLDSRREKPYACPQYPRWRGFRTVFGWFDVQCKEAMSMANKAPAKPMTKSEIVSGIADATGLTKKQVGSVFEAMAGQIKKSLSSRGPGAYAVPGLMKLVVVRKPATPARKGINPFTGQETMFKARPARNIVKIRPLKSLKDMV